MEIVINTRFGGFGLSETAVLHYAKLAGLNIIPERNDNDRTRYWLIQANGSPRTYFSPYCIERNDQYLVQTVKDLGPRAAGDFAKLLVVEVPDDVDWEIVEYDGLEHVAEKHRTWR